MQGTVRKKGDYEMREMRCGISYLESNLTFDPESRIPNIFGSILNRHDAVLDCEVG